MLLLLLEWLSSLHLYKIPSVFFYSSTRMLLAALTTLLFTLFVGPFVIRKLYLLKTGQSIRVEHCEPLAKLHAGKKSTPTMGGVLILVSILISLFLWMDLKSSFTLILAIATIWLGFIGGIDDFLKIKKKNSKGLPAKIKFIMQLGFCLALAAYLLIPACTKRLEHRTFFSPPAAKFEMQDKEASLTTQEYMGFYFVPFKKNPFLIASGWGLVLAALFMVVVIAGASNAVNLSDGLDGLASGLVLMVAAVLAAVAFLSNHLELSRYLHILYIEGSGEIAVFLSAMFGSTLGFLWYNACPAEVFMGDVGSLALGGLLGVCAVLLRREFLLALVGGVLVFETLSVMIQVTSFKLRRGKRVFLCTPIHHHFEYKGWPETKVVIRFWIAGLILALIGLASLKFQ